MISIVQEDKDYLVVISLDDHEAKFFIQQTLILFTFLLLFTLFIILGGIFYIVKKHRNILTFQIERNEEIERFTKNISMLPESIYKCKDEDGELLLTYNYGKSIDKKQEISLESTYRPLKEFYSDEYVKEFRNHARGAFKCTKQRK